MTLRLATAISARLETQFVTEAHQVDSVVLTSRCADITELLAHVEAGHATVVALSADFPGLNASRLAELSVHGVHIVGVCSPTSQVDARTFEGWGVTRTYVVGSGELLGVLDELLLTSDPDASTSSSATSADAHTPGEWEATTAPNSFSPDASRGGRLVSVWGPAGAPGRTTIAANVATLLSRSGRTLLVDADTVAPSVAGFLGLLDDTPATLAAARLVDAGTLNVTQLRRLTAVLSPRLEVLSGIAGAARWSELGRHHLERLLEVARTHYDWVVVDTSGQCGSDEGLLYDTVAPHRHAATIVALEQADAVVAVTAGDPIGLQRFVTAWPDVLAHTPTTPYVVVNKARAAAVGGTPEVVVSNALKRFADVDVVATLPADATAFDEAVLRGQAVVTNAPHSEFARALIPVLRVLGVDADDLPASSRRRWRRRAS